MFNLLKRSAETAVKLPFAMAWDLVSLGNMGDGASTTKVLREHEAKKRVDDFEEAIEKISKIAKNIR